MLKFSLKSQTGIVTFISHFLQKAWVRFVSLFDLSQAVACCLQVTLLLSFVKAISV